MLDRWTVQVKCKAWVGLIHDLKLMIEEALRCNGDKVDELWPRHTWRKEHVNVIWRRCGPSSGARWWLMTWAGSAVQVEVDGTQVRPIAGPLFCA